MEVARPILDLWSRFDDSPLTEEDAQEIVSNLRGFFEILARWNRERKNAAEETAQIPPESH